MIMQAHSLASDISVPLTTQDDIISEYVAGHLSPAKDAVIACAIELNADLADSAALQTDIASLYLEDTPSAPLCPLFIGEVLEKLPDCATPVPANDIAKKDADIASMPVRSLINKDGLDSIQWKSLIPGVAVHDVLGDRKTKDGDRLYLLKAKGGMCMPEHSHTGEEWSLILTGAYHVDGKTYRRGDLHIENETSQHSPEIAEGEDCICLIMTEGPLIMKHWIPKLVQRIVGI